MNEANLLGSTPDPFKDPETRAALKTLATYTSRHERASQRALQHLKALQNERAARTNFAGNEADPSPLVETNRVRRALLSEIRAKAYPALSTRKSLVTVHQCSVKRAASKKERTSK